MSERAKSDDQATLTTRQALGEHRPGGGLSDVMRRLIIDYGDPDSDWARGVGAGPKPGATASPGGD